MFTPGKEQAKQDAPYTDHEKSLLLSFGEAKKESIQSLLKNIWNNIDPEKFPSLQKFCDDVLLKVQIEPKYQRLLTPGRLHCEGNRQIIDVLYAKIRKDILADKSTKSPKRSLPSGPSGPSGPSPSSSSSSSSAPSPSSSSSSSSAPTRLPGIPLEDENYELVRADLGLSVAAAKQAVKPYTAEGGPLRVDGVSEYLYHRTGHTDTSSGAHNPTGANVITFFYVQQSGTYYLVAIGHHIDKSSYKIDDQVSQTTLILKNKVARFL